MFEIKLVRERRVGYGARRRIRDAQHIFDAFQAHFAPLDREQFVVVLLDGKNQVLGFNVVSTGSLTAALVHPREVFKPAIAGSAAALILVHYVARHIMHLLWPPSICGRERRSLQILVAPITRLAT